MTAVVEFETLPQLYSRLEERFSSQPRAALRYKEKKTREWVDITWAELGRHVRAFAGYLHSRGVRHGDRVAILSENRPEWALTDMATQHLGAVNVSLYTSLPASQVEYILRDSGSKLLVVSTGIQLRKAEEVFDSCPELEEVVTMSELRKEHPAFVTSWSDAKSTGESYWKENENILEPLGEEVSPDDLAVLIYTSGTTGKPKGAMLTHRNICSNANAALSRVPFMEDDHHLSFLPLCHVFERTGGYTCVLAAGATISYAESIQTVNRNLPEVRPTVLISVPRLFERMYNVIVKSVNEGSAAKRRIFNWAVRAGSRATQKSNPGPLLRFQRGLANRLVFQKLHERLGANLKFAVSGGAALPAAIGEFFLAAGVKIIEGYGLTETAPVLSINPFDGPRFGTVGHVIPGVLVAIQRISDGEILAELSGDSYPSSLSSEEGEILAKGPNIMKGYWNNDQATSEAIDANGWYHTGDIGKFDGGYLMITDRLKHMIVSKGGKNIYPGPIEELFSTVTWIDQIMVVGEGREFLSALVVPDFEALSGYAKDNSIAVETDVDLISHPEIKGLFEKEFRDYSRKSAAHEKIRDFRLISEPFSIEEGTMTPTLKLRRRQIEVKYSDLIEEIYADVV